MIFRVSNVNLDRLINVERSFHLNLIMKPSSVQRKSHNLPRGGSPVPAVETSGQTAPFPAPMDTGLPMAQPQGRAPCLGTKRTGVVRRIVLVSLAIFVTSSVLT